MAYDGSHEVSAECRTGHLEVCVDVEHLCLEVGVVDIYVGSCSEELNVSVQIYIKMCAVRAELRSYLDRHPAMDAKCTKNGNCKYLTTEDINIFLPAASIFLHESINAETISLQDIIDR